MQTDESRCTAFSRKDGESQDAAACHERPIATVSELSVT